MVKGGLSMPIITIIFKGGGDGSNHYIHKAKEVDPKTTKSHRLKIGRYMGCKNIGPLNAR